jgi:hypothetical protein
VPSHVAKERERNTRLFEIILFSVLIGWWVFGIQTSPFAEKVSIFDRILFWIGFIAGAMAGSFMSIWMVMEDPKRTYWLFMIVSGVAGIWAAYEGACLSLSVAPTMGRTSILVQIFAPLMYGMGGAVGGTITLDVILKLVTRQRGQGDFDSWRKEREQREGGGEADALAGFPEKVRDDIDRDRDGKIDLPVGAAEAVLTEYRLVVGGEEKVYRSLDEMPEYVRKMFDRDRDGKIDLPVGAAGEVLTEYRLVVGGEEKVYRSLDEMPEYVRKMLDRDRDGVIDDVTTRVAFSDRTEQSIRININGKEETFSSWDDVPEDLRERMRGILKRRGRDDLPGFPRIP